MTIGCDCATHDHLAFDSDLFVRRIHESKRIRRRLAMIARHSDTGQTLGRCKRCGQLWQSCRAWAFETKELLFKVPDIAEPDWLAEPYVQPDLLLVYVISLGHFLADNDFDESEGPCRIDGCPNKALERLGRCLEHHVSALQGVGLLPKLPPGRWFEPYRAGSIGLFELGSRLAS